jgi:hypothetical protein
VEYYEILSQKGKTRQKQKEKISPRVKIGGQIGTGTDFRGGGDMVDERIYRSIVLIII